MNKNRMRGRPCRANGQLAAKPLSIKGTGCKFGGGVRKAVELTSGGLPWVPESGLGVERSILTGRQKSAAGKVVSAYWDEGPNGPPQGGKRSGK